MAEENDNSQEKIDGSGANPGATAHNVEQTQRTQKKPIRLKFTYILAVIVIAGVLVGAIYFLTSGSKTLINATVASGDNISVYYTGSYQNGTVFGSDLLPQYCVYGCSPINFIVGAGQMIPGVDSAVVGMKVGETKNITLLPEQGYGYINQTMQTFSAPFAEVVNVSKQLYNTSNVSVGETFTFGGYSYNVTYFNVTNATLDMWPFLAGKILNFELKVARINN